MALKSTPSRQTSRQAGSLPVYSFGTYTVISLEVPAYILEFSIVKFMVSPISLFCKGAKAGSFGYLALCTCWAPKCAAAKSTAATESIATERIATESIAATPPRSVTDVCFI